MERDNEEKLNNQIKIVKVGKGDNAYYRVIQLTGILGTFSTEEEAERFKKREIRRIRTARYSNNFKPKRSRIKKLKDD